MNLEQMLHEKGLDLMDSADGLELPERMEGGADGGGISVRAEPGDNGNNRSSVCQHAPAFSVSI